MRRRFLVVCTVSIVSSFAGLAGCCQSRNWKGRFFRTTSTVHIQSIETTTSSGSSAGDNAGYADPASASDMNPGGPGTIDASQQSYDPDNVWQPNIPSPESSLNDGLLQDSPLLDEVPREPYGPIEVSPVFRDPT